MPITYILDTGGALAVPTAPLGLAQGGPAPVLQPLIHLNVSLPDAYAGNVTFSGKVSPVVGVSLGAGVVITGSPIALPGVPGSGTVFWCLQVNLTTGVVSMK